MEINSVLMDTSMVISYKVGVDSKGNDIIKNQRANDLSLLATDDDLMDLADTVAAFIEHPISEVVKESVHLLSR